MNLAHAVILLAASIAGCAGGGAVVRIVDGRAIEGRYIDSDAYDAYLRGAIAEQDGNLDVAAAWFEKAREADPNGVEALVRLGAVQCQRGAAGEADRVFAQALARDAQDAELHVAIARCALVAGDAKRSEAEARRAMRLDPNASRTTIVLAEAIAAQGRSEAAAQVLDGWVVWSGGRREAWRAVLQFAVKRGDAARQNVARSRLDDPPGAHTAAIAGDRSRVLRQLDQALARGELQAARAFAVEAHLPPSAVAVRAVALGCYRVAEEQASFVLAAEPGEPDAIAAVLALPASMAFSLQNARISVPAPAERSLSALAALVIARAIRQRAGDVAAQSFLDRYGSIAPDPEDPLISAMLGAPTSLGALP